MKRFLQCIGVVWLIGSTILNFYMRKLVLERPVETHIDTVLVEKPILKDSIVLKYITPKLPVAKPDTVHITDTFLITKTDSVRVVVPISQKVYEGEEYTAWVSGFQQSLDSINLRIPHIIDIRDNTPWIETSVGLQLGVTYTQNGLTPYAGVGLQLGIPLRKIRGISKHAER